MQLRALSLPAALLALASAAGAAGFVPQEAPAKPAAAAKGEAKLDAKVDLRGELATLEQVWKRRTALHWLKGNKELLEALGKVIDPVSAQAIGALVGSPPRFDELDYHYVEKQDNCEERLLASLRVDQFRGVADLLEVVATKNYPASVAYADLMAQVELNWRFAAKRALLDDSEETRALGRRLAGEAERIRGTAGHAFAEIAKDLWKDGKPDDFPAAWFDASCEVISFQFGPIPDDGGFPRVDLATATREQLLEVPGIDGEAADAIVKQRAKRGMRGPEELRFVEALPARDREPLQTLFTVGAAAPMPKKKWTVMVYLNAANNLEPFGIKDMNEMESAGSSSEVNIVVECARFRSEPKVRPNGAYLSNPFAEHEPEYYRGLDNQPGTRRWYVLKDDDPLRVRSVMLGNIGETDAGRPEPLADFGRYAIENFPAENYALVIWNHGAGWSGVSADENTHHTLEMRDVRVALESIQQSLHAQGKSKLDVLDFDACLMATLEVAYELRDTVDFLASSQETEPGDGMAYGEYLRWLNTYPEAPPASLAKAMVETYVRAYAPGGVQVEGDFWSGSETKSALRLSKIAELKAAVEEVAKLLHGKKELLGEVADQIVKETRAFGNLVDLQDFLAKVVAREKGDVALKAAAERVIDLLGYPADVDAQLVNEVILKRRSPGAVIWGFNGWASPPRNLAPFVANSRHAKTPLAGPDEKGDYVARIAFPPMLKNGKTGKLEFVTEINWHFEGEGDKRTAKDFKNWIFTADFPSHAAVIAEGHAIGNHRSHGLSIYFPTYLGFDPDYLRLQFAQDSAWTELVRKFPIRELGPAKPVALLGLNHVTKGTRAELGKAVVFEELERKVRALDVAAGWQADLKALGHEADAIRDPKPYGLDWNAMLEHFEQSVVVLDNHAGGETGGGGMSMDDVFALVAQFMPGGGGGKRVKVPRFVGPEGRDLMRHLQAGGRVLLGQPGAGAAVWDTPLYRDTLGVRYVRTWDRGFEFGATDAAKIAADQRFSLDLATKRDKVSVLAPVEGVVGVTPFVTLPDGQWLGAKVARRDPETGREVRAVVLGFYLADVQGDEQRRALLAEALHFLGDGGASGNLSATAEPVAAPSGSAVGPASGSAPAQGGS